MTTVAIIPARAGSKGLPNKNELILNGKPLIAWSIEQAMECKGIDRVLVSTDSPSMAGLARGMGAEVPELRPAELAQSTTTTEAVILHALSSWCPDMKGEDYVVLLQPTSPLRMPGSIEAALQRLRAESADSLVSVGKNFSFFWRDRKSPEALYDYKNRPRRQDILEEDLNYMENGSVYASKVWVYKELKNRLGGRIALHVMEDFESFEIDNKVDFLIVEQLMKEYLK